jgi:3-oxoacyl-[acyl-carrier protein] reductase
MSVVVVTGGTRGIGRAVVAHASVSGWRVVFCGRGPVRATTDDAVMGLRADVSVEEDVEALFAGAMSAFRRVDAVVHCAGVSGDSLLVNLDDAEWARIRDTNLQGGLLVSREAIRAGASALVLVGSMYQHGAPANAAYAASKGAMWGLTQHLSGQYPRVKTNLLVPGYVETDLTESLTDDAREALVTGNPLERPVTADEVATAAMFLLDAPFSGRMLHATGGVMEAPA